MHAAVMGLFCLINTSHLNGARHYCTVHDGVTKSDAYLMGGEGVGVLGGRECRCEKGFCHSLPPSLLLSLSPSRYANERKV
jgi:hypothetical protein